MNKLTNRNIFYAPVFIGCLSLFTILLSFEQFNKYRKEERVIRHFIPSSDKNNPYNGWALLKEYNKKKHIEFILKGDAEDSIKIDVIKFSATQIKYSCDTNTIIKVHLRDNITYKEVIHLINIMLSGKFKRYAFWENDFYIFPPIENDCLEEGKDISPQEIYL